MSASLTPALAVDAPGLAPLAALGVKASPLVAKAARALTLAGYVTGTWVHTIGNYFGVVMQQRQIWKADGTYLAQANYRVDAYGLPHKTAWTTQDYGTWKAKTGAIVIGGSGTIYATSSARATKGRLCLVYVRAVSKALGDFGVLPSDASPTTKPVWLHYGKMV